MTAALTIQDVSRRSGLSEPTLRYYEEIGLIGPVARDENSGHRRYRAEELDVLQALACLRARRRHRGHAHLPGQPRPRARGRPRPLAEQRRLFMTRPRRVASCCYLRQGIAIVEAFFLVADKRSLRTLFYH